MGVTKRLKSTQSIFITIIIVVFTPVGLRLFNDYHIGNMFHFGFNNPTIIISILFFAILIPVANRIFNAQMKAEFYTAKHIFSKYISALAVKGITIATVGIFNSIVYISTGNFAALIISIFTIILIINSFPTMKGALKNCGITKVDLENDERNTINEN